MLSDGAGTPNSSYAWLWLKSFHVCISHHVISEGILARNVDLIVKKVHAPENNSYIIGNVQAEQHSSSLDCASKNREAGEEQQACTAVQCSNVCPNTCKSSHAKFRSVLQSEKCLWIQTC